MKKLFLFIPAMLLALAMNAKDVTIIPNADNVLRTTVDACTDDENTITLEKDETYGNVFGNTSQYIVPGKNITIQAAEGANPVIKPTVPIHIQGGVTVKFIGVKFDGSIIGGYDRLILINDNNDDNVLEFEDCEFTAIGKYIVDVYTGYKAKSIVFKNCYLHDNTSRAILNRGTTTSMEIKDSHFENFTNSSDGVIENFSTGSIGSLQIDGCEFNNNARYVIYATAGSTMTSCEIEDCYFHNNAKSAIYVGYNATSQACDALIVENSTFADITGADYNAISFSGAKEVSFTVNAFLSVDHCTFFKHPKRAIYWEKSSELAVSNCIFAQPSKINYKSVECVGGTITNCLSYNSDGYSSAATRTDNIEGNPYFVNIESDSYDFTPASFSPAHEAGTDDKNLGDLRWTSDDAAHATTKNITAGTNAIKAAVEAAWPDDQIVLATGTYNESASFTLDKDLTIKAADGAIPVVKPVKDIAISNGADVLIQNIKFDGTSQSSASNFIYAADNTSNKLTIEGCEFYSISNVAIYAASDKKIATCTIDDCYFHNNTKNCIYLANTVDADLTVTNSTFANNSTSSKGIIQPHTASGDVVVDHCTFYNCTVENTDYGCVSNPNSSSTNVVVSNSIFAMPSDYSAGRAIRLCDGNTINNCLTYHYTADTQGIRSGSTKTNCLPGINPRFDSISDNKYTVDEDSPARQAATDRTDLGDPRWYRDRVIHETDFTSSYTFAATRAVRNQYCTLDANNYLKSNNPSPIVSECSMATWKIHSTRAVSVQVSLDMASTSLYDHQYKVEIFNAEDTKIGEVGEASRNDAKTAIDVPGIINLSATGDYTIKLSNTVAGSVATIQSITLSYAGGDVQTITNTADFETDIDDAYFSSKGTRADGKISFSGDAVASEWVRWNVTVANSDYYDITLNSDVESGHIYSVTFYDGETQVARVVESGWHNSTGAIELGRRFLPAGDYVLEIKNSVESNSGAKIVSVEAVAFVAPTTALPATLKANDAILSELAYAASAAADETAIYFAPSDKYGYIQNQWAEWKVSVASAGTFLFTMDVTSTLEQVYEITILDSENNELESFEKNPGSGDKAIKHYFNLAAGNYFVKVQNTKKWSDGHMVSLVVTEPDDMVTLDEAATSNESWSGKVVDKDADGPYYDVQILRTIKAGMYNTICLPFDVSSSQCKEIFGSDVQLRTLGSASIEEGDYVLNLNFDVATDINHGTPLLIKTSRDIVNPVFIGVKFVTADPDGTYKTNANFIGNFVKGTIEASENNLFLGANNTLYFPTVNMYILGMRAYFVIHDAPAGAIRRARIVEGGQVATEIELVNSQEPNARSQKMLINGQLIIVRDGKTYNALGQMMQ